ncbi:MAG TPA: TIGR02266 family protein [Polyangiaceae bacterium]|nr:TIGR02266 family protein [Polyangiaceae bacterium]
MATMSKNPKGPAAVAAVEGTDSDPRADERRSHDRFEVEWAVDCVADDTFLYAAISNISAMGIFVRTTDPASVGTRLMLAFEPPGYESFKLEGQVAWINAVRPDGDNPNPGMGVRFVNLRPEDRERLVEVIRTIAYVREPS